MCVFSVPMSLRVGVVGVVGGRDTVFPLGIET